MNNNAIVVELATNDGCGDFFDFITKTFIDEVGETTANKYFDEQLKVGSRPEDYDQDGDQITLEHPYIDMYKGYVREDGEVVAETLIRRAKYGHEQKVVDGKVVYSNRQPEPDITPEEIYVGQDIDFENEAIPD